MDKRTIYTLAASTLGAAKLVLDSFGVHVITDATVNDVANAVATIATFGGVIVAHFHQRKQAKQAQDPTAPAVKEAGIKPGG
jgi:uncharacterized membrane protein